MNKSNVNGVIFLKDKPNIIYKKIMNAVTDSEKKIKYDFVNKQGISNLLQYILQYMLHKRELILKNVKNILKIIPI